MNRRRQKAEHEARHIVVGDHCGCRISRATIDEIKFNVHADPGAKIVMLLAGNLAQRGSEGLDDRRLAKRLLEFNWPRESWKKLWREFSSEAERLVRRHSDEIQQVANVIEEKGRWRR